RGPPAQLPRHHDGHHPVALLVLQRPDPPVRDLPRGHRRGAHLRRGPRVARRERRGGRRPRRPALRRPDDHVHRGAPRAVVRGHRSARARHRHDEGPVMSQYTTAGAGPVGGTTDIDPDYPTTPVPSHASKSAFSLAIVLTGFTLFTPTMLAGAPIGADFRFWPVLRALLCGTPVLRLSVGAIGCA